MGTDRSFFWIFSALTVVNLGIFAAWGGISSLVLGCLMFYMAWKEIE